MSHGSPTFPERLRLTFGPIPCIVDAMLLEDKVTKTVLHITGFGNNTEIIRTVCSDNLRQPSWFSSVSVAAESNSDPETIIVVSSLGIVAKLTRSQEHRWLLNELSPCCAAAVASDQRCSSCKESAPLHFASKVFRTQEDEENEETVLILERTVSHALQEEGANIVEANMIAGDLAGLIRALAEVTSK